MEMLLEVVLLVQLEIIVIYQLMPLAFLTMVIVIREAFVILGMRV